MEPSRLPAGPPPIPLSRREWDVLHTLALGRNPRDVSLLLGLAPGTVRNHLSAVYAKLGVASRAEAIAWAWRTGHVQAPEADQPGGAPSTMA